MEFTGTFDELEKLATDDMWPTPDAAFDIKNILDDIFTEVFNPELKNEIFIALELISKINNYDFTPRVFDFDKLHRYVIEVLEAEDSQEPVEDIATLILNYILDIICKYLDHIGFKISTETSGVLYIGQLVEILNSIVTLCELPADVARELLGSFNSVKQFYNEEPYAKSNRISSFIYGILGQYFTRPASEILDLIEDISPKFIAHIYVRVKELSTIEDTSDDLLLRKIHILNDADVEFISTHTVNRSLNEGYIPSSLEESLHKLTSYLTGMLTTEIDWRKMSYELVATYFLAPDVTKENIYQFYSDNKPFDSLGIDISLVDRELIDNTFKRLVDRIREVRDYD